jgi:hypothetical protein
MRVIIAILANWREHTNHGAKMSIAQKAQKTYCWFGFCRLARIKPTSWKKNPNFTGDVKKLKQRSL